MNYFSLAYFQEKWAHAGFQKYLRNTSWLLVSRLVVMVISFFIGAYIARYFGPQKYGTLNYVISFSGLFSFLASLGIDSILVRELVSHPEKKYEYLGTGLVIKIVGGLLALFAATITSFYFVEDSYTKLLIFLFSFTYIFQSLGIIENYFQANVLAKKTVLVQMFVVIISTILKLVFIWLHLDIAWFLALYIFEAMVTGTGLVIMFKRQGLSLGNFVVSSAVAKNILTASWPLMISGATSVLYLKIDQVMIGNMLGSYQAGLYAVAVKFSEIWYFIPGIIIASFAPALINAKKENLKLYYARFRKLYLLMFMIPFGLSVGIIMISTYIIPLLFGFDYLPSLPILNIYIWSGIPVFIGSILAQALVIENKQKTLLFITTLGAISNVLLNMSFISRYGLTGAAYATLISYTLVIFAVLLFKGGRVHVKGLFTHL